MRGQRASCIYGINMTEKLLWHKSCMQFLRHQSTLVLSESVELDQVSCVVKSSTVLYQTRRYLI
jgi:hypothetical protein